MRAYRRLLGIAIAAAATATVYGGCTAKKQTELVSGIISQVQVPRNMRTIRVDVAAEGGRATCFWSNVDPTTGGFTLPRTLGIVPEDQGRVVTVTIAGYDIALDSPNAPLSFDDCGTSPFDKDPKRGGARVLRRIRTRYVDARILFMPMPLRYSCWDKTECQDSESCVGGRCVDANIDEKMLVDFREELVDGTTNLCFSPSRCLADLQPATQTDATNCDYTFTLPPPGQGMNVKVFYDDAEAEILDEDANEGFFFPDPNDPKRIRLAPGLCEIANAKNVKRRIVSVGVASACPPKTIYQPICAAEAHDNHTLPDGGVSTDGTCNVANELNPAPSALYVLLDQSQDMKQVFGSAGLQTVLGFSLSDPVFRNTSIAFKLLPHATADCSNAPMANSVGDVTKLDVPFQLAPQAQGAIASIIGDVGKVLPNNPPLLLDAALQQNGAYEALRTFKRTKATVFNRLATLIVANRTIGTDCGAGHANPSDLAAQAFNASTLQDRIYTYVVLLDNPNGPMAVQDGDARLIARNGGTNDIFDARGNPPEGAVAFNTVVNDLGSCLYELPTQGPAIDTKALIQYTDPLSQQQTTVSFDASCTEASQSTANGWNLEGGRVRICGDACKNLRAVLTTATNLAQAQRQPPPNIPVTATQPCK